MLGAISGEALFVGFFVCVVIVVISLVMQGSLRVEVLRMVLSTGALLVAAIISLVAALRLLELGIWEGFIMFVVPVLGLWLAYLQKDEMVWLLRLVRKNPDLLKRYDHTIEDG